MTSVTEAMMTIKNEKSMKNNKKSHRLNSELRPIYYLII